MMVGRDVLNYVGMNSQANQMFTETLSNPDLDSRMKTMVVLQQAGGGFGPFSSEAPTDQKVIDGRLAVLNSALTQHANDPQLSQVLALAIQGLQSGQGIQPQDMRQIFGGGGGGGGGRRGGNGGGPPPGGDN